MKGPLTAAFILLGFVAGATASEPPTDTRSSTKPGAAADSRKPGSEASADAKNGEGSDSPQPDEPRSSLTGDWVGLRPALERRGLTISSAVTSDLSRIRSSSIGSYEVGRALLDAAIELDLDAMAGWKGATIRLQYLDKVGGNGTDCAGDNQGFSNIDAPSFRGLGEAWIEQRLLDDHLRLKVGRVDANSEFAANHSSAEFLNSSMGYSPTILLFPTYPNPKFGVNAFVTPARWLRIGAGVYDGVAREDECSPQPDDGLFTVGEVTTSWAFAGRVGALSVGAWHNSSQLFRLDDGVAEGTAGWFLSAEHSLWHAEGSDPTNDDEPHVDLFVKYGSSDPAVSEIARHIGAGLVARGIVPSRPADAVGFGVTRIVLSDRSPTRDEDGAETALGPFYRVQVSPWLAVKPDFQYIFHPAGIAPYHRAWTFTVRFLLTL
jgi:porin